MPSFQSRCLNGLLRCLMRPRVKAGVDPVEVRRRIDKLSRLIARPWPGQFVRNTELGGVPCDYLEQEGHRKDRAILYLHGGGFMFHAPLIYQAFLGKLCAMLGMNAWLPDYRLAPEHPFPAAPEDGLAAYRGLLDKGIAPENIVVMGDSAGGCLTLVTLQQARARGLPMPACAVTFSPVTEGWSPSASFIVNGRRDPMFSPRAVELFRTAYLGDADPTDPRVSPYYGNYEGLPPLLMLAGSSEMLLSDTIGAARRAANQGVAVHAQVWTGMPHVWPLFDHLPEAREACRLVAGFVTEAMADPAGMSLPDEIHRGLVAVNTFPSS